MPPNIAALLHVVTTLLGYGRHLAATIERRAASPGFSLFGAMFGTRKLPIILAHLHRGILRAAALEALLQKRAATGRDIVVPLPRTRVPSRANAAAAVHPADEPIGPQAARLAAERARYDAPVDPDHLPTQAEIEAEVRCRPIGRTIAAITRDFGIIPGMCTRVFWDALTDAIALYDGDGIECLHAMNRRSEQFRREQEADPDARLSEADTPLYPHQTLGFRLGEPPVDLLHDAPAPPKPGDDVPLPQEHAAAPVEATGPPPSAAAPRAA